MPPPENANEGPSADQVGGLLPGNCPGIRSPLFSLALLSEAISPEPSLSGQRPISVGEAGDCWPIRMAQEAVVAPPTTSTLSNRRPGRVFIGTANAREPPPLPSVM